MILEFRPVSLLLHEEESCSGDNQQQWYHEQYDGDDEGYVDQLMSIHSFRILVPRDESEDEPDERYDDGEDKGELSPGSCRGLLVVRQICSGWPCPGYPHLEYLRVAKQ